MIKLCGRLSCRSYALVLVFVGGAVLLLSGFAVHPATLLRKPVAQASGSTGLPSRVEHHGSRTHSKTGVQVGDHPQVQVGVSASSLPSVQHSVHPVATNPRNHSVLALSCPHNSTQVSGWAGACTGDAEPRARSESSPNDRNRGGVHDGSPQRTPAHPGVEDVSAKARPLEQSAQAELFPALARPVHPPPPRGKSSRAGVISTSQISQENAQQRQDCCSLPVPGVDVESLSRFNLDRCEWWCPHGPSARENPSTDHSPGLTRYCYHASPKSGSSLTLLMLKELLSDVAQVLGYKYKRSRTSSISGMFLTIDHGSRTLLDERKTTKHILPRPSCRNIVTTRDPRDQVVSIWHFRKPSISIQEAHYCEDLKNEGPVDCGPQLVKYANYTRTVFTEWPAYEGLLLLNYPTLVQQKVQAMQYMLDYMGFRWRDDLDTSLEISHRLAEIAAKFDMKRGADHSSTTSGDRDHPDTSGSREEHGKNKRAGSSRRQSSRSSQSTKQEVHFRSGVPRYGFKKELSEKGVNLVNSILCEYFPIVAAVWEVEDCDLSGPLSWWLPKKDQGSS